MGDVGYLTLTGVQARPYTLTLIYTYIHTICGVGRAENQGKISTPPPLFIYKKRLLNRIFSYRGVRGVGEKRKYLHTLKNIILCTH